MPSQSTLFSDLNAALVFAPIVYSSMRARMPAMREEKEAMIVSEVNIQLIKPCDGLVGFASVVLDGQIYLSSIGIHQRLDGTGYRITYPTKKNWQSQF